MRCDRSSGIQLSSKVPVPQHWNMCREVKWRWSWYNRHPIQEDHYFRIRYDGRIFSDNSINLVMAVFQCRARFASACSRISCCDVWRLSSMAAIRKALMMSLMSCCTAGCFFPSWRNVSRMPCTLENDNGPTSGNRSGIASRHTSLFMGNFAVMAALIADKHFSLLPRRTDDNSTPWNVMEVGSTPTRTICSSMSKMLSQFFAFMADSMHAAKQDTPGLIPSWYSSWIIEVIILTASSFIFATANAWITAP